MCAFSNIYSPSHRPYQHGPFNYRECLGWSDQTQAVEPSFYCRQLLLCRKLRRSTSIYHFLTFNFETQDPTFPVYELALEYLRNTYPANSGDHKKTTRKINALVRHFVTFRIYDPSNPLRHGHQCITSMILHIGRQLFNLGEMSEYSGIVLVVLTNNAFDVIIQSPEI